MLLIPKFSIDGCCSQSSLLEVSRIPFPPNDDKKLPPSSPPSISLFFLPRCKAMKARISPNIRFTKSSIFWLNSSLFFLHSPSIFCVSYSLFLLEFSCRAQPWISSSCYLWNATAVPNRAFITNSHRLPLRRDELEEIRREFKLGL